MGNPINKIQYKIGQQLGNCIYLGNDISRKWTRYAMFKCVCGNEFEASIQKVKSGHTKTCGCLLAKINRERLTTHGLEKTREYTIWVNMKQRCYNPNNKRYSDWGGRGIKVCDRWLNSFENFLEDMGNAPSPKHSIERLENNKDYYKENCTWKTNKQQANNRRSNVNISYKGETKTLKEWCEILGIEYTKTYQRVRKLKWTYDKAFNGK